MSRWILIIFFGILFSCTDSKRPTGTIINGSVKYPESGYIYLELLTPEGFEVIDSARADATGTFSLQTQSSEDDIYRINFYNNQKNTLVVGGSAIEIVADGNSSDGMFIARGNPGVEDLSALIDLNKAHQLQKNFLRHKINSASQKGEQAKLDSLIEVAQQNDDTYLSKATDLVRRHKGSLVGLFMLTEFFDIESNLDLYRELMPTFQHSLAEHWFFRQSYDNYKKISRLAVGAIAPDFELPDPQGNLVALSSLRGKYVYLDFWASWCQPCRRDNPYLVKVYEKYKKSNFEILGVSFDRRKERWLDAIEKDHLTWIHVSDLKYFDSEMIQLYNITNVPTTFLLDPEGRILAKNLHHSELDQMLSSLL